MTVNKDEIIQTFYKRFTRLRTDKGFTPKDVAILAKVSLKTVYDWNKYLPNTFTLAKLSNIFDVSIDYLCGLSNETDIQMYSDQKYSTAKEIYKTIETIRPNENQSKIIVKILNDITKFNYNKKL